MQWKGSGGGGRGYGAVMPTYRVHQPGVAKARKLIDSGHYDDTTEWSDAAPSTSQENDQIDQHGYDGYGEWHLGVDPDASAQTRGRYRFPYGDFSTVNRAALIHAKQRATQNDHDEVADAADELLSRLDGKRSWPPPVGHAHDEGARGGD